ncbi:GNAT family N-acetyltransferase [Streptomyces griseus]|uniref:GNAT family N-acetyltransferase n=1 Tax=Streptomyces griseus TaxID=1911 RepID=UPI000568066B|nr:GNAT family N-acetyltransferase [Streptomyces griseus]
MPPTDPSAEPGTAPLTDIPPAPGHGPDSEDTLDLQLPDELLALIEEQRKEELKAGPEEERRDRQREEARSGARQEGDPGTERMGTAPSRPVVDPPWASRFPPIDPQPIRPPYGDLLDHIGDWGPASTPVGKFYLVPVSVERDLPLVHGWMTDPAVAAYWELAGPLSATEQHLSAQLAGDGRSVPCLGLLEGTPMSYWEIYRADLDPLARHYPARPHDTGLHLLIGAVADRGRGLGSVLLRAVADLVLERRPACARVVAEPDLRNVPSVAAFLSAGFRYAAEVDLPAKRAALMVRDRSLRHLM